MPSFTPNFSLPYPSGTDEPCDFAQDWCAFTEAVNGVATRFETTVNRTVPLVPMARMVLTEPVTILNTGVIPFDSVTVNTAGWVDFDTSTTNIVTDRAGYFVIVADVLVDTLASLGATVDIRYEFVTAASDGQIDRFSSSLGLNFTYLVNLTTPAVNNIRINRSTVGNVTINAATFSMWWHSDTATP